MVGRSWLQRTSTVLATAMLLVGGCASLSAEPAPERILIAADLELTGDGARLGRVLENALRLRVEQVNEQELLGRRRLELVVRDNRSDSATSAANLAEFASNPQVITIITGGCGECTVNSAEYLESAAVPVISLASASEIVEPLDERRYLFKLGPTARDNARVLATEAARADLERIAVVATDDLYGAEGERLMADAVERADIEVALSRRITGEESAIAQVASEIVNYQPSSDQPEASFYTPIPEPAGGLDAVVLWLPEPHLGKLAVALREQGYEGLFLLDAVAADELFLAGAVREALQGARMVFPETLVIDSVIATSPAKAARQTWFREYTAQEGTYHAYSSFAADAVQVVMEAINRVDEVDRETVRTAIENVEIDGLTGPIRIQLENHAGLSPQALTVLVAQGDRWRLATS